MDNHIVLNSAQCMACNDVITSHSNHDFVTCKCGDLSVDGGTSYLRRLFKGNVYFIEKEKIEVDSWKELSVLSDVSFEVIRENLYRGSLGIDGRQTLKWVKLSEISNLYLASLIKYCNDRQQDNFHSQSYLKEYDYRVTNNIHIEE